MLSKGCEYGLRAVFYIASNSKEGKKTGIKEIAKQLKLPAPFLAKTLQGLVKQKILSSTKGPNGGFYLSKDPSKINVLSVIEAIDGLDFFKQCALGFKKCSDSRPCPIHSDIKEYRTEVKEALSKKTLAQIIEEAEDKKVIL